MWKKIASIIGNILKGISCRSTCCIESSCNKREKNEIIDEVVEVVHDIIDGMKVAYV
jgi:hypothetical protein